MTFQLVRATENDLPFIMATERREGYGAFVGVGTSRAIAKPLPTVRTPIS
ncbi:hypothetical protein MesoLj113a_11490 [Mesorhizobium sp. 113-1-2]|nr:hypothetical protein [Mesorhizobium sp. 113-1-2]BCG69991.1 hypothetical protein MesoLj113a_11490 [Mesorhizobium sp. 113-1-2]